MKKETGVKYESILNELADTYHFTTNFCFDLMHDLLCGQGEFSLKLVISKFVLSDNYNINVDILN